MTAKVVFDKMTAEMIVCPMTSSLKKTLYKFTRGMIIE